MYYLKTESSFDSAHFLKGYNGKCRNLHGHRWRVVVEIAAVEQFKIDISKKILIIDISHKNARQFVCTILSLNKTRAAKKTFYVI